MNRSHFCFNQNKFSEMQLGGLRKKLLTNPLFGLLRRALKLE